MERKQGASLTGTHEKSTLLLHFVILKSWERNIQMLLILCV